MSAWEIRVPGGFLSKCKIAMFNIDIAKAKFFLFWMFCLGLDAFESYEGLIGISGAYGPLTPSETEQWPKHRMTSLPAISTCSVFRVHLQCAGCV